MSLEFVAKHGLISRGNVIVTGSVTADSFTGSLFGTASWSNNTISSSYSSTPSVPIIKSNIISGSSFEGFSKTSSIIFTNPFPDNIYSISVTGESTRIWNIKQKSETGFEIDSNSDEDIEGMVFWQAMQIGEFN